MKRIVLKCRSPADCNPCTNLLSKVHPVKHERNIVPDAFDSCLRDVEGISVNPAVIKSGEPFIGFVLVDKPEPLQMYLPPQDKGEGSDARQTFGQLVGFLLIYIPL